jgi:single-strand DNA-binding protein
VGTRNGRPIVSTTVTVAGNVTRDPEVRYTGSGMAVASFSVAVSERSKNRDTGEWEDGESSFYDVTCFRLLAESAAEAVSKGQRVVVTGKLRQSRWEDKATGANRSKVEIIADDVARSVLYEALPAKGEPSGRKPAAASVVSDDDPF